MPQFTYDYYNVTVPGDCADDMKRLGEIAIDEASERTKLYAVPALWTADHVRGEVGDFFVTFRVRRKRNRTTPACQAS